jgi:uncharacterized membrane protein HdeD (DUF308 family)
MLPAAGSHLFIAAIYGVAAINLLVNPLLGVVLLVLLVGVVLIAEGLIEIILFFFLRQNRHAIGILIDGIVTAGLGILVCAHWPPETFETIHYVVGLSLISSGVSRLVLSFGLRLIDQTAQER